MLPSDSARFRAIPAINHLRLLLVVSPCFRSSLFDFFPIFSAPPL